MDAQKELIEHERWHAYKLYLRRKKRRYFDERQIWWFARGFNIGDEEDGKGERFLRPVLIIRKFNQNVFWGVPVTSQNKSGQYYLPFIDNRGNQSKRSEESRVGKSVNRGGGRSVITIKKRKRNTRTSFFSKGRG